MATKKYSFDKILKEYNKRYSYIYKLPSGISDITITHIIKTNKFQVTYTNEMENIEKESLEHFLYYRISHNISSDWIKDIIRSKEEKKLNLKIEIWPPNKVRYAYLYSNYFANNVGNLGKSCMRGKDMQKSLSFYIKNKVGIVVVIDATNKIHARALLWPDVKSTKDKKVFTYLDRVYTNSETLSSLFIALAKENKWEQYKGISAGNASSNLYIDNLDIKNICHLPYTDTFRYLYHKDNTISSGTIPSKAKHKDDPLHLTTTGAGGYFPTLDPNRTQEAFTGDFISKKDAVFVKKYKDNYDGYVLLKNIVSINGAYYSIADNKIVKTKLDGYILKESSVEEVITTEMISKTTAVFSDKYKGYIHKSNVVSIKDELYHKKDTNIISFRGKWYHVSQCFINYDRKKRNIALSKKQFHFWIEDEVFIPYPDDFVTRKDDLIPKECAMIAYDLTYNPVLDEIEFQEVCCIDGSSSYPLVTGERIVRSSENRKYLKKFNNKWYMKRDFNPPDKKQLQFSFMRKKK